MFLFLAVSVCLSDHLPQESKTWRDVHIIHLLYRAQLHDWMAAWLQGKREKELDLAHWLCHWIYSASPETSQITHERPNNRHSAQVTFNKPAGERGMGQTRPQTQIYRQP